MFADKLLQIAQRNGGEIDVSPAVSRTRALGSINNMRLQSTKKEEAPVLEVPRVLKTKELDKFFLKAEMVNTRELAIRRKSLG